MKPDLSQWQSNAAYSYVDHLDVADVAWEWLRRNREYQQDFALYLRTKNDEERSVRASGMTERWGLRFPRPSKPHGPDPVCILDARSRRRHPSPCEIARLS
ncbi:transcriptional regulator domain-containing protein [Shinella sp. NM-101]|uniref:transcriptional regulator domain-containing protein n=1 Tax=Shinella sp. NM-101 TaxID=2744455 RepID=UPI001F2C40CA|nr:DUF6499 domain-containing protein [Shinella sp. NM-101]